MSFNSLIARLLTKSLWCDTMGTHFVLTGKPFYPLSFSNNYCANVSLRMNKFRLCNINTVLTNIKYNYEGLSEIVFIWIIWRYWVFDANPSLTTAKFLHLFRSLSIILCITLFCYISTLRTECRNTFFVKKIIEGLFCVQAKVA